MRSRSTRPPRAVWPWLAQMGPSPRGGAYTYDWIENLLGLDMHSVDRILPSSSIPEVGDTIGFGANQMRLERVEPERVLAWRSEDGNWVWTFVLDEQDGTTRLISRNRFRLPTLGRAPRDAADGARVPRDGAEDAARNQGARGAPREQPGLGWRGSLTLRTTASSPKACGRRTTPIGLTAWTHGKATPLVHPRRVLTTRDDANRERTAS